MLIVTAQAGDRTLLTAAELRTAAGLAVGDTSKDANLATLGVRVAAAITSACKVARAGATPPTLREETLQQTCRLQGAVQALILARRPIASITSVTVDGDVLDPAEYEFEAAAGLLYRVFGDRRCFWRCRVIVIVFVAGWATVPDDLKLAASKFVQALFQQGSRDPMLRSVTVDGVGSRDFWVDPTKDTVIPPDVMDLLDAGGYTEITVG